MWGDNLQCYKDTFTSGRRLDVIPNATISNELEMWHKLKLEGLKQMKLLTSPLILHHKEAKTPRRLQTSAPNTNTCSNALDGDCDDGGPGSEYNNCAYGTDYYDCGSRGASSGATATCSYDLCGCSCEAVIPGDMTCVTEYQAQSTIDSNFGGCDSFKNSIGGTCADAGPAIMDNQALGYSTISATCSTSNSGSSYSGSSYSGSSMSSSADQAAEDVEKGVLDVVNPAIIVPGLITPLVLILVRHASRPRLARSHCLPSAGAGRSAGHPRGEEAYWGMRACSGHLEHRFDFRLHLDRRLRRPHLRVPRRRCLLYHNHQEFLGSRLDLRQLVYCGVREPPRVQVHRRHHGHVCLHWGTRHARLQPVTAV